MKLPIHRHRLPDSSAGESPSPPAPNCALGRSFATSAVLQQGKPVPVWGLDRRAGAKSAGRSIRGQQQSAVAGPDGRWQVALAPMQASAEPADLKVTAGQTLAIHDVLVGEVWICSGQSNMEWHVRDVLNADQGRSRRRELFPSSATSACLHVIARNAAAGFHRHLGSRLSRPSPFHFISPPSRISSPTVSNRDLNVPIGLINTSWGRKDGLEVFADERGVPRQRSRILHGGETMRNRSRIASRHCSRLT